MIYDGAAFLFMRILCDLTPLNHNRMSYIFKIAALAHYLCFYIYDTPQPIHI